MKLHRLCFLAVFLTLTAAAPAENESLAAIFTNSPASAHPAAIPRRASIIFLACRGLACGDLSCYGQTNFQTPNLDRLAGEGMRFTDYRAAADDLSAAQAALLAGNNAGLPPGQPTLASQLQHAGYFTAVVGQWSLGRQPWAQGFTDFAGFLNDQEAADYYSPFWWQTAPHLSGTPPELRQARMFDNEGGKHVKYMPEALLNAAVSYARIHVPNAANHYRPFFLLVTLPVPHSVAPDKDVYPVPTDAPYTSEPWPQAAKNRAALLTRLDADIGRFFENLQALHLTNNVAVFITGATAPEKFADPKLNFLQLNGEVRGGNSPERLRTPMIVHWPEHVPAGRVSATPWTMADFASTALAIAYVRPADATLLPTLLDQSAASAPPAR